MENFKRILWTGVSVIALCIFAVMMLLWYVGGRAIKAHDAAGVRKEVSNG